MGRIDGRSCAPLVILVWRRSPAPRRTVGEPPSPRRCIDCGDVYHHAVQSQLAERLRTRCPSHGVVTSVDAFEQTSDYSAAEALKIIAPRGRRPAFRSSESSTLELLARQCAQHASATRISVRAGDRPRRVPTPTTGLHRLRADGPAAYVVPAAPVNDPDTGSDVRAGSARRRTHSSSSRSISSPTADNDGFGDETQDCAPDDPARHDDCVPPRDDDHHQPEGQDEEEEPRRSSSAPREPGSTFECSLNGAPFAPLPSPDTVKGKKGKNHFEVRATGRRRQRRRLARDRRLERQEEEEVAAVVSLAGRDAAQLLLSSRRSRTPPTRRRSRTS